MSLDKNFPIGSMGNLEISESGLNASLKLSLSDQAGGGVIAGFIKGSLSAEIDVGAQVLIDAGLSMAESKYPAFAGEIAALKALIDAEMSKA